MQLRRIITSQCGSFRRSHARYVFPMIVMGSSLEVYPVAQLPAMVTKLVVVNLLPTPYDDRADYVFHESTGEFSENLEERYCVHCTCGM